MFSSRCICLNESHQLLLSIPFRNGVSFICVSFATFIFSCCRLMDNPHSCMSKVHFITTTYFFSISTPFGPIFLNLLYPFRRSLMELISMSHDLFTFLKECVPLSTTSIATSNISSVHMPLMVFGGTRFSCGADILFCGL